MANDFAGYTFPVGPDVAFKFGCGRFRMEEHLLERCADEVLRFGHKPLFVCNDTTCDLAYDKVSVSLRSAGVEPKVLKYNGFCCREAALELAQAGAVGRSAPVPPAQSPASRSCSPTSIPR